MKRTTIYEIPVKEFKGLVDHLHEQGTYQAYQYGSLTLQRTSDDGSSTRFEDYQQFELRRVGNENHIKLEIRNSQLATTIDAYFGK